MPDSENASDSFLLARIITDQLRATPIDTALPDWQHRLPSSVHEAFESDLMSVGQAPDRQTPVQLARHLLTALTWGLGPGLPELEWRVISEVLVGSEIQRTHISWALDQMGRYVVEAGEGGVAVYRLASENLANQLRTPFRPQTSAAFNPAAVPITAALIERYRLLLIDGRPAREPTYLWRYISRHAALAGTPGLVGLRSLAEIDPELKPELVMAYHACSRVLARVGNYAESTAMANEALAVHRAMQPGSPPNIHGDSASSRPGSGVGVSTPDAAIGTGFGEPEQRHRTAPTATQINHQRDRIRPRFQPRPTALPSAADFPAFGALNEPEQNRARTLLTDASLAIDPVLRDAVASLTKPLDIMAGYHFGWRDANGTETTGTQGKALRPALTFATAVGCGGTVESARHAAAAVELLHHFSLVHDDVMDEDRFRHGRPTVWRVWGETNATLLGDALQALALGVLSDGVPESVTAEAVIRLARATVTLCRGQYEDNAFAARSSVTVDEYLTMAAGKTGALLGCACALGALCAGADHRVVSAMHTFGCELGLVFQLVDDAIDIWGDPEVTGKPAHSDLIQRKQSFPVVYALASNTDSGHQLARIYNARQPMTAARAARAADLIEEAGGRRHTLWRAATALESALNALPPDVDATDLTVLAHLVAHREA